MYPMLEISAFGDYLILLFFGHNLLTTMLEDQSRDLKMQRFLPSFSKKQKKMPHDVGAQGLMTPLKTLNLPQL